MPAAAYVMHSVRISTSLKPSSISWLMMSSRACRRRARIAGFTSAA